MDTRSSLALALSGRYEIERELGAGGMATVYLASDVKHARQVALKVLHPELAAALGPERFLAEIRTTANLQHPHILPLHDSGEADGFLYYVMPFVAGESLRQRLERETQLPIDDAVRIARELLSALDYAHRHGVIHRDIKPENILLHDGAALVADFGIALAVQSAGGQRMTQTGLSLGTPQYMSPEQAMGEKHIDGRADIYAAGAVLYEMLSGEPPFTGASVQAIVAKVMTERPMSPRTVRDTVPPGIEQAVLKSLANLPADRFATAAQFAEALTHGAAQSAPLGAPTLRARRAIPWIVTAVACVIAAWATARATRVNASPLVRAELTLGDSAGVGVLAILPGDSLLVIGGRGNRPLSLVRVATGETTPLRGTEGATAVGASPDGRSIVFVARQQLWRMALLQGAPVSLAPTNRVMAVEWSDEGRIAISEDLGARVTVIPAAGGVKDTLPRVNATQVLGIAAFPRGRWLLSSPDGMWMVEGRKARRLTRADLLDSVTARDTAGAPAGGDVQLLSSGYLAWMTLEQVSVHRLMIAPIDIRSGRLTGAPVAVADSVTLPTRFGTRGLLLVAHGTSNPPRVLVFADRNGRRDTLPHAPDHYFNFDVSPDGRRVAIASGLDPSSSALRLLDVGSSTSRVLPTSAGAVPFEPRWTPDGKRFAVELLRFAPGTFLTLNTVSVLLDPDSQRADTLYRGAFAPQAWTPDGRELAGNASAGTAPGVLARMRPGVDTAPRRVAGIPSGASAQSFSPDGHWYVFKLATPAPDQSGIYVAENRDGAVPSRVADGRFGEPQWTFDGREIIVLDAQTLMFHAIPVRQGSPPAFKPPVPLFRAERLAVLGGQSYHVLRDGRIAYLESAARTPTRTLTLLTDWRAEYARRAPTPVR